MDTATGCQGSNFVLPIPRTIAVLRVCPTRFTTDASKCAVCWCFYVERVLCSIYLCSGTLYACAVTFYVRAVTFASCTRTAVIFAVHSYSGRHYHRSDFHVMCNPATRHSNTLRLNPSLSPLQAFPCHCYLSPLRLGFCRDFRFKRVAHRHNSTSQAILLDLCGLSAYQTAHLLACLLADGSRSSIPLACRPACFP